MRIFIRNDDDDDDDCDCGNSQILDLSLNQHTRTPFTRFNLIESITDQDHGHGHD